MRRLAQLSVNLTPRDLELIRLVYAYDGCGISHVRDLLWPSLNWPSACYRRIQILGQAGYLRVHRLPALTAHGSGKALITPGPLSLNLISDSVEQPHRKSFSRMHEVSAFFAEHHFAICDFRVALELSARTIPDMSLDGWVRESEMKKNLSGCQRPPVAEPKAKDHACS